MSILDLFRKRAEHLHWDRVAPAKIYSDTLDPVVAPAALGAGEAYLSVFLSEMYVRHSRKLWRKFYPMLHGFVDHAANQHHSVAGPGQLKELGESNLERVVTLNRRLAGPFPFRGEDVMLTVGLYSVPGEDMAKTLIETASAIGELAGLATATGTQLANVVKGAVDAIAKLDNASLQIGANFTFKQGDPMVPGLFAGIAAATASLNTDEMFVVGGHLKKGADPQVAMPYEDRDYMLVSVQADTRRFDWPRLPDIAPHNDKFQEIMRAGVLVAEKRKQLGAAWPAFQEALANCSDLIASDAEQIADEVTADLRDRLDKIDSGGRFEIRAFGDAVESNPSEFELADVAPADGALGLDALTKNPFE